MSARRSASPRYRKVVGLGLCVVDHLYYVDAFDSHEVRTRYRERRVGSGGMTANAVATAARLGCNTHILSVVGDDAEGRQISRDLRRAGVKTRGLLRSPSHATTVAVVMVERVSGERRFLVPDRRRMELRTPALDLACIDGRTLLLVDGHFPAQTVRAVRRARAVGATVIGDFARPDFRALPLLPFVDHPVLPEEFVLEFHPKGPRAALLALREQYGGAPVVTLGEKGGLYWHAGRVHRYRARRVVVRDTTGAGDAFHGAFAAGLYRGLDVPGAIELAAREAARCCRHFGGPAAERS